MSITVSIPDDLHKKAVEIAKAQGISVDEVFASAFAEQLAAWERSQRRADEVCAVLGASGGESGPRFRPLPIRGESLSSSILRERR